MVLGRDADGEDAVRLAREVLARKLGVAADQFQVEDVRPVEWPDSSLGCPEKGVMYAQMLVPGYSVRLRAGEAIHDVHVGGGRAVTCRAPAVPREASYMESVAKAQALARRALAARLKVDEKSVKVSFLRPAAWPDASLGCPERGRSYEKGETRGFLIELEHKGRRYRYHSDLQRVVACDKR